MSDESIGEVLDIQVSQVFGKKTFKETYVVNASFKGKHLLAAIRLQPKTLRPHMGKANLNTLWYTKTDESMGEITSEID